MMPSRASPPLGFAQIRVRCHGSLARVELPEQDMARALQSRREIAERLQAADLTMLPLIWRAIVWAV